MLMLWKLGDIITKGINYQLLTDRREGFQKDSSIPSSWQPGAPELGSGRELEQKAARSVLHTLSSSQLVQSLGKWSECYCRWPNSPQWAEARQSARGPLWGWGTYLVQTVFVPNSAPLEAWAACGALYNRDWAHLEETQKGEQKKPK